MKKLFIIILLLSGLNTFAQNTILHENVEEYTYFEKKNFGVNNPHFIYMTYRFGFYTPSINAVNYDINYFRSTFIGFSTTYKLKLFNWMALGANLNYNLNNFYLNDVFYYSFAEGQSEKLTLHTVGSDVFFRFNFGKHGNSMGKYIDLGAFGDFNFYNQYTIKYRFDTDISSPFGSRKIKLVYKNMNIFEYFQYGAVARIGINQISFVFKYRLSGLLTQQAKDLSNSYELPNFSAAVEFSIY